MPSFDELSPAYILHYRKYRDTSLILDLFSRHFGKFSAVARGARGPRSRYKGLLQPFVPLLVSCFGKGELKTVKDVDFHRQPVTLKGDNLLIGLYLNELINRLAGKYDPLETLYEQYEYLIGAIGSTDDVEPLLRRFEIAFLSELGYGVAFNYEAASGRAILADEFYHYDPNAGFVLVADSDERSDERSTVFQGRLLMAIHDDDYVQQEVRIAAKKIVRSAVSPLLGGRPLNSRVLFAKK